MSSPRRALGGLVALAAWVPLAAAQPASIPRIGMLDPTPSALAQVRKEQFRAAMKSLGYDEGRSYVLEYRSAEGRFDRLPGLARELVGIPVRVLIVRNTPGTNAARAATQSIPIVMADVGDPLGLGFVKSLSRPGGNITGVSNATLELIQKRLEILRELLPAATKVAVLGNSNDPNTPFQVAQARAGAKALGLQVRVFDATDLAQLETALKDIDAWKPHAVLTLVHPLRQAMTPRTSQWAVAARMPVIFAAREDLNAGGLMAFSADLSEQWRNVALYVDRLLRGAKAAELPVERPSRYLLALNPETAKAIGLTIPPSVMVRVDEVVR